MNKTEFINFIAERNGVNHKVAQSMLDTVLDSIEAALIEDQSVKLKGFGTFEVKQRKARLGRNPHNPSETYEIEESAYPAFKAGSILKERIK